MAAELSLTRDDSNNKVSPSVVPASDANKNDFVLELQELWSPDDEPLSNEILHHEEECVKQNFVQKTHDDSCEATKDNNDDDQSMVKIVDEDAVMGASATTDLLSSAYNDTIKSMDLMMIAEDGVEDQADMSRDLRDVYEEVEALMYGMNKKIINHKAAIALAKQYPQDPVMIAVQALLLPEDATKTSKNQLWKQAEQCGLESRAKQGCGLAQALAGVLMERTVEGVYYHAESRYEQGAEQNRNATAQFLLGKSLEESRDYETANTWYSKAAAQGHSAAQTRLGLLSRRRLLDGIEHVATGKHNKVAKCWFRQAALQGDAEGSVNLAFMFFKEQNNEDARYWYNKAVVAGYTEGNDNAWSLSLPQLRDGDQSAKYWFNKAQSNLSELFVQSDSSEESDQAEEDVAQDHEEGTLTKAGDLLSRMRSGGLQVANSDSCGERCPPSLRAALEGKQEYSATATLTSIMTLQSLSIGSMHTLSVASTDSLRRMSSVVGIDSDETAFAKVLAMDDELSLLKLPDGAEKNKSRDECLLTTDSTLLQPAKGQGDTATETSSPSGLAMSSKVKMAVDNNDTVSQNPDEMHGGYVQHRVIKASAPTLQETYPLDVIQPFHAVLGDRSARGPRLTVGTKELRHAKEWYRENRLAYQRRGRQGQLLKDAMDRYFRRMRALYGNFPQDKASREKTILIHCSKHALDSDRVQDPNCFRHDQDAECHYGTARFSKALLFYFNGRDPPKLDDQVARYRRKLESKPKCTGERRDYFEKYLSFCEMTVGKAAQGSPAAQLAAEKINFIPTLRALWEDLEKSMSDDDEKIGPATRGIDA